jgi:DNA-binding MarR family transcriptional regulator
MVPNSRAGRAIPDQLKYVATTFVLTENVAMREPKPPITPRTPVPGPSPTTRADRAASGPPAEAGAPGRASGLAREIRQRRPFDSAGEEVFLALQRTAALQAVALAGELRTVDLSPSQYNVLRILRGSHPTALPCSEVAMRMVTPDPDVTRLLDRLERRELVIRTRSRHDRRVVEVTLAGAGFGLLERADPLVAALLEHLFSRFDPEELAILLGLLDRLRELASASPASQPSNPVHPSRRTP